MNFFRLIIIGLLVLTLPLACASNPPQRSNKPAVEQAVPPNANEIPYVSMTPELMYKVLVAEIARQRGEMDISKKEYDDIARKTRDPRIIEMAARVAFLAQDQEMAMRNAKLWVEIAPEDLEARKLISLLLIRNGKTLESVAHLEKLTKEFWGENLPGFIAIARLLGAEKDAQVAYQVMKQLVAKNPGLVEAQFALSDAARRAEDFNNSFIAIDKVLAAKPDWQEAIIFKARLLQAQGKANEAVAYLEKNVTQQPENINLRVTFARLLLEVKQYEKARQQFKKIADMAPDNADIIFAIGGLSMEVKQYDEAEIYLKKLLELNQKMGSANFYLGQIAEQRSKWEEAIKWFGAVEQGEHYLIAQIRIALIHGQQKQPAKAHEHLDKIEVSGKEQKVRIHIAHGEIFRQAKEYRQEFDAYQKGLKEFPGDMDLIYMRALSHERLGDLAGVEKDLRDIIQREPENAAALNALGYTLADRTKRFDEAHQFIKKALELKPDDPAIMDSMGWVLYRLGNLAEAEKYLRKAMDINDDPEIAAHLGEVLWQIGNQQAAKDVWDKARKSAPENEVLQGVMHKFGQM